MLVTFGHLNDADSPIDFNNADKPNDPTKADTP
jgi:hypothetical protein